MAPARAASPARFRRRFHMQDRSALAPNPGPDDLDRRIAAARAGERGAGRAGVRAENKGWAVGIEFVGVVLVSTAIGFAIDRATGSAPWAMIGMLVLGFAAGVYRAAKLGAGE
jgi:ATP synthase protein I